MAERAEVDAHSGTSTTGHEWDGIKELNTPLPRWWLWLFYATIVWAFGYWVVYPSWPLIQSYSVGLFGYSSRAEVATELADLQIVRGEKTVSLQAASLGDIERDPALLTLARAQGRAAFGDNCAPCHGIGATGAKGYPNLNDDDWLWGGTVEAIHETIQFGVRSGHKQAREGAMIGFGKDGILKRDEIVTVANYVRSLSGLSVLIDFPNRKFYFFFIEIWPQEVYYFTGLLIIAALALFLMNSIGGRIWCGYLCPQTVWTDLFYAVEQWIEGDRRERIRKDKQPLTARRFGELAAKHSIWLLIAWWTGGAWVLYFADAPTLVRELATGEAPAIAYISIAILTFTTYSLAGFMREQVCVYMCPWPRIQAALTDEWALNVTYRYDRGEPRTSFKKAEELRQQGLPAGDCIDCHQCVAVCPTGIDIRDGAQLGCISCGLCIDACDTVMAKTGRPLELIAYDTDINVQRRRDGKPNVFRVVRPRTVLYAGMIALVGAIMLYALLTRSYLDVSVVHDRNPLYVALSDGSVRNAFTVHFLNKRPVTRTVSLAVEGLAAPELHVVGLDTAVGGEPLIAVGPDQIREFRLLVTMPPGARLERSTPLTFRVTDVVTGETAATAEHFVAK